MEKREQMATKIMMNALEGVKAQIRKAYDKGYKNGYVTGYDHGKRDGYEDGKADTPFTDTEEAENKAYSRGLDDAWEAARKLCQSVKYGGLEEYCSEIFEKPLFETFDVFDYTAPEAIAKIKAYEDKQKQDDEIKVGDEVMTENAELAVAVRDTYYVGEDREPFTLIWFGTHMSSCRVNKLSKTGRTFPQITEVMKELRGTENDE